MRDSYLMFRNVENQKLFVETWIEAYENKQGVAWIARKLKISRQSVASRANHFRERGVNLPKLQRGYNLIQVDEMNEIIRKKLGK